MKRAVYIVDDDDVVRSSLSTLITATTEYESLVYPSGLSFISIASQLRPGCVLLDLQLGTQDGIAVLEVIRRQKLPFSVVVLSGTADVHDAIRAMKAGAIDFLQKPYSLVRLLSSIARGFHFLDHQQEEPERAEQARSRYALLTTIEPQILLALFRGETSRNIAQSLGLSLREVEFRRAAIFEKLQIDSLIDALQLMASAGIEID